ncbi:MAG: hypothetical protein ACLUKN_09080 [Bacilli bacterium]
MSTEAGIPTTLKVRIDTVSPTRFSETESVQDPLNADPSELYKLKLSLVNPLTTIVAPSVDSASVMNVESMGQNPR